MSDTDSSERLVAQVKWFNPSSGYGFATVRSEGGHKDEDIFVHHTAINVEENQYKYLKKGEYVHLSLEEADSDKHKWHGVNIRGVLEGKLMCEVLNDHANENQQNNENREDNGGWEKQGRRNRQHNNRRQHQHRHHRGSNRQQNNQREED